MDPGLPVSRFRLYPLVLGVIGRPVQEDAERFFGEAPGAQVLMRTGFLDVRAVGPIDKNLAGGFFWGAATASSDTAVEWRQASEAMCAAGLYREEDGWVLFTDALGVHSIYTRQHKNCIFFATRQAPLLALPGSLNVDWEAWSTIFVLASPIGPATPFAEVRRLEGASGLRVGATGSVSRVSFSPTWLDTEERRVDIDDLVEAIRLALPPRSWLEETPGIPLSGGWDSRLLAALAVESYRGRLQAWTTDADDGLGLDLAYTPAVARRLSLRHRIVEQPGGGFPDLATETRSRLQYETWLHPWFTPLCRQIRLSALNVLDGLAGGILIRGQFLSEKVVTAVEEERVSQLFDAQGYRPARLEGQLRPDAARAMISDSRRAFQGIAERFDHHLNQLILATLHTRTIRAIAQAPLCLLSPEVKPWFPFIHPQVLRLSLAIDPGERADGRLYHRMLAHGAAQVADLPSSNDLKPKPSPHLPSVHTDAEATRWMADLILASAPARSLLSREFAARLRAYEGSPIPSNPRLERVVQALSLFAQWESRHRSRLAGVEPPW